MKDLVVDIHAHFIPKLLYQRYSAGAGKFPSVKLLQERIMLGSDMPFPIGDPEPKRVVEHAHLTPSQKKSVLGETAQKVFRVRADCWCRS